MTIDVADRRPAPRVDNQDPALFGQTPSQTVGPFFHYGLPWKGGADLVGQSETGARPDLFPEAHYVLNLSAPTGTPAGDVIELTGRVVDGDGAPVPDAMLEIWQADAAGRYFGEPDSDPHFVGFGRAATGEAAIASARSCPARLSRAMRRISRCPFWTGPHQATGDAGLFRWHDGG